MNRSSLVVLVVSAMWSIPAMTSADPPASGPASAPASRPGLNMSTTRPVATRPSIIAFPAAAQPASPPAGAKEDSAEAICQAALDWFDRAIASSDKLVAPAEMATAKVLQGGQFWVAGNPGFTEEFDFRAGGFPFTKVWPNDAPTALLPKLRTNDVVMLGEFRPNEIHSRYLRPEIIVHAQGPAVDGMMLHLAGHSWPSIQRCMVMIDQRYWGPNLFMIDTGGPEGGNLKELAIGQMSAAAIGWSIHGEMMSAATRMGKTLATYASDFEPAGKDWDNTVKGRITHPTISLAPIPAGKLATDYLTICRQDVAEFAKGSLPAVKAAAAKMAEVMKNGGFVWVVCDGHIHVRGAVIPPELSRMHIFGRGYEWTWYSRRMAKGDMLLYIGYLDFPANHVKMALDKGCTAAVLSVHGPEKPDERVIYIPSCWKDWDTCINLPNYPVRVLSASGVVQTPQWYAILAETIRCMRLGD